MGDKIKPHPSDCATCAPGSPALLHAASNAAAERAAAASARGGDVRRWRKRVQQSEENSCRQVLKAIADACDQESLARAGGYLFRYVQEETVLRDCGQRGVCRTPPGCARHWEERNRELVRENEVLRSNSDHISSENASLARQVESMAMRIESLAEELAKPEDVRLREVLDALDGRAVIFDGLGARVGHLLDEMDEWIGRAGEAERLAEERLAHANQLQADIEAEMQGRLALRKRLGAREDETMGAFLERLAAMAGVVPADVHEHGTSAELTKCHEERDEARAKLSEVQRELAEARAAARAAVYEARVGWRVSERLRGQAEGEVARLRCFAEGLAQGLSVPAAGASSGLCRVCLTARPPLAEVATVTTRGASGEVLHFCDECWGLTAARHSGVAR